MATPNYKSRKNNQPRTNNRMAVKDAERVREKPAFAREGKAITAEIQNAVTALAYEDFAAWATQEYGADCLFTYQTLKSVISAYIEAKLKIRYGVYFTEERGKLTLQVGWVKSSTMQVKPAEWMGLALSAMDRPKWNIDTKSIIELPVE